MWKRRCLYTLYELEKKHGQVDERISRDDDLDLDAIGRASDALLSARDLDLIAQRSAMARLAELVADTPGAVGYLEQIHAGGEMVLLDSGQ